MNKKYYWLKLQGDWFKSKLVKKLRKIAGGDTYTIIYLKMLLTSLETGGKLYYEGYEDTFEEELALDIDEDEENVKVTVAFLKSCGLLEVCDEGFQLLQIEEMTGSESTSAKRVREHRKKQKMLQCNTDVTQSNKEVTYKKEEIEKEIEKEKEKDKKEKNSFSSPTPKTSKQKYGEFENVQLTVQEYTNLTDQEKSLIPNLDCYIESTGKRYKSHYAVLKNWARRVKQPNKPTITQVWNEPEEEMSEEERRQLIEEIEGMSS